MTQAQDAEVIVVGAGHNGLVCAAYLARAGVDTLLVDARPDVGGVASTVTDLDARFNICNCDHLFVRAMPIIEELELASYGLRYLESEIGQVSRFHDDAPPWLFFHDVERHLDTLAASHPNQVDAYRRYLADALPVARMALDVVRRPPSIRGFLDVAAEDRARGGPRLVRWGRASFHEVMEHYFDDWHLTMPAVSTGPTVWGIHPDTPGSGLAALGYATRHVIRSGRPEGGSGALTDSIRASFETAGGRLLTGRLVERLLVHDGTVTGIELAGGDRLSGRRIVAATDPRRVLLDWLDDDPPGTIRPLVERERAAPDPEGYESKLDLVIDGLPTWRHRAMVEALAPGADDVGPTSVVSPSPGELDVAHRRRTTGEVADRPTMLVNVPSVLDPSMQPAPGQHVMSVEVLFTPYGLRGGWAGSKEPERWIEVLDGLMEPGTLRIDRWRAMTPDRYEREFLMHRGHTPGFAGPPLSTLIGRDRALTRHRAPIGGLYLSGAGTFPGAGVFGAPGRNAAHAVLTDRSNEERPWARLRTRVRRRGARPAAADPVPR